MITKSTYYKNEIYTPHSVVSVSSDVTDVEESLFDFIEEYEREALISLLGYHLAIEFINNLDASKSNGLVDSADEKWNELLNGKTYSSPDTGKTVVWRGIRFKSIASREHPDVSMLAYYVYYNYQSNSYITMGDTGAQIVDSKNAQSVVPTQKVVKALSKFIAFAQKGFFNPKRVIYSDGLGVDYYEEAINIEISLYKFIYDSNNIVEDYYADFTPKKWNEVNQFGI
tara:strand:- start:3236 stop:3916 length:681 start_codon:yes stop_codon:yes gene_type:complete